jgi:hypothetical protein
VAAAAAAWVAAARNESESGGGGGKGGGNCSFTIVRTIAEAVLEDIKSRRLILLASRSFAFPLRIKVGRTTAGANILVVGRVTES